MPDVLFNSPSYEYLSSKSSPFLLLEQQDVSLGKRKSHREPSLKNMVDVKKQPFLFLDKINYVALLYFVRNRGERFLSVLHASFID